MARRPIDTDKFSLAMRERAIDSEKHKILITNFHGSRQEKDLTDPANCDGFGRVRHFRFETSPGWPKNPLPIEPAIRALGLNESNELKAQVFQNAACNWRCWYCYVDFALLSADHKRATFLTPNELVELYLGEHGRPLIIDLTGGQPDLVPEWVPWMMEELVAHKLEAETFLWSDDNLSNDYFWRFLRDDQIELISNYENYAKVCCFKGFDETSFAFNTLAAPELYDQQFELMARQLTVNIDLYCYVTFTTPDSQNIAGRMAAFVDRLQDLHPHLPLRTVPLQITVYTPTRGRIDGATQDAISNQQRAAEAWSHELTARFSVDQLSTNITQIHL